MKIGISGLGSLGLVVGAILSDKGYDVTLIDSPMGNNREVIHTRGIRILGYGEEYIPANCLLPNEIDFTLDVVFLLTKHLQLKESLQNLKKCIGRDTLIVTCQNGIPEDEAIQIVPQDQIISCSIAWGATRLEHGVSKITSPPEKMDMVIGELHGGITERLAVIQGILEKIGKVELSQNIKGIKWTKLIMNANFMGPCGVLGCTLGEVLLNKDLVKYVPYIALEGTQVCQALQITPETLQGFTPDPALLTFHNATERQQIVENVLYAVWLKLKDIKPSLVQDLEKNKKTEIDYINGKIVTEGKRLGIPTPVNSFFVVLIKEIEAGKLKPSMDNAKLLEALCIE